MLNNFKYPLNYYISKTKVNETINIQKIIIRHMYKTPQMSRIIQKNNLLPNAPKRVYYTQETCSLKKHSQVVKDLAADDTGTHPHLIKKICTKTTCEVKRCPTLCKNLSEAQTKGFFTHKPIVGKYCKFISDIDAKNKEDTQYYVKNTDKTKKISSSKAQNYEQNKDMKPNLAMNHYINQPDIDAKIPE